MSSDANTTSGSPARWQRLAARLDLRTRVFDVNQVTYRHPSRGTEKEFVVMQPPDWVNVVAVTPTHELVLVQQFRFGINGFSLEIPGGVMESGEDPVETGARELREETGYAGRARLLGSSHPNPAIQANRCHFVLVEQAVRAHDTEWDADEEIAVLTRPVDEVYAAVQRGEITHALVLNALLLFAPIWEKQRGRPAV